MRVMSRMKMSTGMAFLLAALAATVTASGPTAAQRGYEALTRRAFNPAIWNYSDYENVWRRWGLKEKPAEYAKAFAERYGLHAAPYPNGELPMGLRETKGLLGGRGITNDCMICHGGSIFGKSYIGLGNAALDIEALFAEMFGLQGGARKALFPFCNVRGTSEAAAMAVFLLSIRDEDLKLRAPPLDLGLRADLCEDVPPWWHLKRKKTIYADGGTDSRSVRTLMQFTLSPLATPRQFPELEPTFKDIREYLLTIEAPKYPLPIDERRAAEGKVLFKQNCERCHGTYGAVGWYPNKIIELDEIGADPVRAIALTERAKDHYLKTWFGQETAPDGKPLTHRLTRGYQAPPLDGIWATAPYLHNGSAPTVYDVLNSTSRPARFTRSYRTNEDDYDPVKLGWKVTLVKQPPPADLPDIEKRKIYDTSLPGRGNQGHAFGDCLTDAERYAIIEYLKTL
jgi:hypothetical protein